MARFEKLQDLFDLLWRTREPLSLDALCAELRVSPATAKRLIAVLRDNRGLDLRYQRDGNGYVLARGPLDNSVAMLLGLSSAELEGLIEAEALLGRLHPGLLRSRAEDERSRLARVRRRYLAANGLVGRLHWRLPHAEHIDPSLLSTVLDSLRRRCRLSFEYRMAPFEVSPVQLVWHMHGVQLAAWCHSGECLKTFALAVMQHAQALPLTSFTPDADDVQVWLDQNLKSTAAHSESEAEQRAILHLDKEIEAEAQGIAWHAHARIRRLPGGITELEVPYVDDQNLTAQILRLGADVEVIAPPALRKAVARELARAARRYRHR